MASELRVRCRALGDEGGSTMGSVALLAEDDAAYYATGDWGAG